MDLLLTETGKRWEGRVWAKDREEGGVGVQMQSRQAALQLILPEKVLKES